MASKSDTPKSFGLLLYPQFEVLDWAGPIEALNTLSRKPEYQDMTLSVIAKTLDPVTPGPIGKDKTSINFTGRQLYLPTHTFETAPVLDVLLVPGGYGSLSPLPDGSEADLDSTIKFIRKTYEGCDGKPPLRYAMSVCTGAALFARAGILDGHRATSNKAAWGAVTPTGPKTYWVAHARWVVSGNIWTTSGVSAGTDGMIAWMSEIYPQEIVDEVVNGMEYNREPDPDDDPFQKIFNAQDVPPQD